VIRTTFIVLLTLVVLQGSVSPIAVAQSGNNCIATNSFWFGDTIPRGWSCVTGQGPFMLLCTGPSSACGATVWCPTCGQNVPVAGLPINLTNGNTYIQQTDVSLPGLGGGLNLNRTWSSIWPSSQGLSPVGLFGPNWRSNFEESVFMGSAGMQYARGDGSFWIFASGSNANVVAPANVTATLTVQGTTSWTITFQNGEQRIFNYNGGALLSIIDRNGNATQLSYDSLNRLVTVTDPVSRHLYFTYNSNNLVTGVTSDVGLSLSYSYDTQGRLIQITKPDLTTLSFQYDSNSLISAVLDSNGNVLESHTYDSSGRGLTASRAGGVEAVTVSYPQ
jgi:YD repeat-containing protein